MKLIFFTLFLLPLINGQAACSFPGCNCSAGNSCTLTQDVTTIEGHQTVTGGSLIMFITNQIRFNIPTSRLDIPDGAFVVSGNANFTISDDPGKPYTFIKAVAITPGLGGHWSPPSRLFVTGVGNCPIVRTEFTFTTNGEYIVTVRECRKETTTSIPDNTTMTKEPDDSGGQLNGPSIWQKIVVGVLLLLFVL